MAKDKKKNKQATKSYKKGGGAALTTKLKKLSANPLAADVVAAALVATASALKDSNKARALAIYAGDELTKLSKANADRGNVLWQLALDIGRRSLEAINEKPKSAKKSAAKAASKPKAAKAASKPKPKPNAAAKPRAKSARKTSAAK